MAQAPETEALAGRELLLEVACRLFMEAGYDGVSMQQIASAAHMTKGSPYYHFKGKEDLFLHAFKAQVKRINDGFLASLAEPGSLRERLTNALIHMLTTTNPDMIRMIDDYRRLFEPHCTPGEPDVKDIPEVMRAAYEQIFAACTESLRWPPAQLADALMAFQLGTVHLRVIHSGAVGTPMTEEEARIIARDSIGLFLDGALQNG